MWDSSWYLSNAWIIQVCKPTIPVRNQINDQSSLLTCTWLSLCCKNIHKATRFWIRKIPGAWFIGFAKLISVYYIGLLQPTIWLAMKNKGSDPQKKKNLATCIILGPRSPEPLFFQSKSSSQSFFLSFSQKTFLVV